ncbi:MAG TPA: hypothetical protein VMU80_20930 [Bryobacteraceae bacterium]|nr:hypothetical protein [Bryobacteraceae bacterium]
MKISYSLLFAFAAVAQTRTGQPVSASVDASKTGAAISPCLYGQFVEHAGRLVYISLWSEMLDDRKFYNPVVPATATPPDAGRAGRGPGAPNPGSRERHVYNTTDRRRPSQSGMRCPQS